MSPGDRLPQFQNLQQQILFLQGAYGASASLDLASFTMEIRAARTSSGVLTGLPNARRTGRGPSEVIADRSKPYLSTPVEVISVPCEEALQ